MIQLKDLNIAGELVLAPMAGYTDSPFRRIARKQGAVLVFSELISAQGIVSESRKTRDLLRFTEEERPIGIQLFGNDPDIMGEAARQVSALKPDIIDINFGCCAPKVCKSGSGAALLRQPEHMKAIAERVIDGGEAPVSAKIRIGWDAHTLNYMTVARALQDAGISLITVHGRTRSQRFAEEANWNIIREINRDLSIPVIGNGDIRSHSEARERLRYSGCPAVMIGRGALGNPWIFSGKTPDLGERIDQIREHLGLMMAFYGQRGIILMRKHLVKYMHGIKNASRTRNRLVHAESIEEIHRILDSMIE